MPNPPYYGRPAGYFNAREQKARQKNQIAKGVQKDRFKYASR